MVDLNACKLWMEGDSSTVADWLLNNFAQARIYHPMIDDTRVWRDRVQLFKVTWRERGCGFLGQSGEAVGFHDPCR